MFSTVEMYLHMELLTFPASLLKGHSVPPKIMASTETGEGCSRSVVLLPVLYILLGTKWTWSRLCYVEFMNVDEKTQVSKVEAAVSLKDTQKMQDNIPNRIVRLHGLEAYVWHRPGKGPPQS
ncbi:hypothetical protein EV702DRAFT_1040808 [Suillus placidus]|uniref:Uncharacterized protein n=1 Tax=Suillus placidus TaxID=48579 RepID=A0A9P7D7F3_9AGAM|nr:hypothetical protein EV702DRAFT_1040808 [Suillus placidus]